MNALPPKKKEFICKRTTALCFVKETENYKINLSAHLPAFIALAHAWKKSDPILFSILLLVKFV